MLVLYFQETISLSREWNTTLGAVLHDGDAFYNFGRMRVGARNIDVSINIVFKDSNKTKCHLYRKWICMILIKSTCNGGNETWYLYSSRKNCAWCKIIHAFFVNQKQANPSSCNVLKVNPSLGKVKEGF